MKANIGTRKRKNLRTVETKTIVVSPMRQLCTHRIHNSKSVKHLKGLFSEISMLIAAAKERVAVSVNAELTMLYWSAGKNEEHVELLELGRSNIRVASYMTELPPKKVLEAKFRLAIEAARNRLAAKEV